MIIKYSLERSPFFSESVGYTARVQEGINHDLDSIVDLLVRMGSTLNRPDIKGTLDSFLRLAAQITARGETITTDVFSTSFSITGVFSSAQDQFDPRYHNIKVNTQPGKALKAALKDLSVKKVTTPQPRPIVAQVQHSHKGSEHGQLYPGQVLEIIGSLLKIEGEHPNNGIYFVAEDGTPHKVYTLADNKPGRLLVLVPPLPPGNYTLHITTQYKGGTPHLKTPRTGTFTTPLTVA